MVATTSERKRSPWLFIILLLLAILAIIYTYKTAGGYLIASGPDFADCFSQNGISHVLVDTMRAGKFYRICPLEGKFLVQVVEKSVGDDYYNHINTYMVDDLSLIRGAIEVYPHNLWGVAADIVNKMISFLEAH